MTGHVMKTVLLIGSNASNFYLCNDYLGFSDVSGGEVTPTDPVCLTISRVAAVFRFLCCRLTMRCCPTLRLSMLW